jgi:hypothetical protein
MAISKKPKFAVVLTKEAIGLLKDENIYLNLVKGKCFEYLFEFGERQMFYL